MIKWGRIGQKVDEFDRKLTYSKCGKFVIAKDGHHLYSMYEMHNGNPGKFLGLWQTMREVKDFANEIAKRW